jgi:hypothetical protein
LDHAGLSWAVSRPCCGCLGSLLGHIGAILGWCGREHVGNAKRIGWSGT